MGNPVAYVEIPETEIMDIMQIVGRALDGKAENTVFLGLLALAVFMRNPSMDGDQLKEGVKGASEWISMYTDNMGGTVN